ncbi:MAG: ORC1-type DNA replication protein [Sulfolobaceae archaeon]|nr:ORC1-type DNA replication protein [Sulfolobaceae archaeon]
MQNPRDILNEIFSATSVFKDKSKLSPDYIPPRLPHREDKIKELGLAFKDVVTNPGSSSQRVIIVGRVGTGKTATSKAFGQEFKNIAKTRGIKLEYVHLNCHRQRTLYLLMLEIANQLKLPIPSRGLSSQEIFELIHEYLEKRGMYLIVAFDEFDYFLSTSPLEDIYFLVRIYDELNTTVKRVNYLFIVRELGIVTGLDKSVKDHIMRRVIEFKPYTSAELQDILQDRIKEAFYENTVMDDVVKFIADTHGYDKGGTGNARAAIETLEVAGELADRDNSPIVTLEHAKEANSRVNPEASILLDSIRYLELHDLILLRAIIALYNKERREFYQMGLVEEEYKKLCEELGEEPRKHTQVYEYIRRLRSMGILSTRQSGKGMRGRTTLISLSIPISPDLVDFIDKELRGRLQ